MAVPTERAPTRVSVLMTWVKLKQKEIFLSLKVPKLKRFGFRFCSHCPFLSAWYLMRFLLEASP